MLTFIFYTYIVFILLVEIASFKDYDKVMKLNAERGFFHYMLQAYLLSTIVGWFTFQGVYFFIFTLYGKFASNALNKAGYVNLDSFISMLFIAFLLLNKFLIHHELNFNSLINSDFIQFLI